MDRAFEIGVRIDLAELGALDQAVEDGGDLCASLGAGAEMILPTDDERDEARLRRKRAPELKDGPGLVQQPADPLLPHRSPRQHALHY
jgi:hypothetical protein